MAGTKAGGEAAARTNKSKYGPDFYAKIGAKGGAKGRTGGFAYMKLNNPERLKELGSIGGAKSRRPKGV